jgi:hypothetical protein
MTWTCPLSVALIIIIKNGNSVKCQNIIDKKTPFLSSISDQPLNTNSISKRALLVSDTSRTITEPDASQLELSNHIIILKTNFIKYVTNNKQLLDDVHIDLFSKIMSTSSQATEITIICTYYNAA